MTWLLLLTALAGPTGAQAAQDVQTLVELVEALHPDPYRYADPGAHAQRVDGALARLGEVEQPDALRVARTVHEVLAPLRDSHIAVGLDLSAVGSGLLPLAIHHTQSGVIVKVLPDGAQRELLAIDDVPINTLWKELSALVMVDGNGTNGRDARTAKDFVGLYAMRYGLKDKAVLTLASEEGTVKHLVKGVGLDQLRSARPPPDVLPLLLAVDDRTALIRLPTFGSPDEALWLEALDAAFAAIPPDTERLVLDVRGNEGGLRTRGMAVLDRLIDGTYGNWTAAHVRTKRVPRWAQEKLGFPFTSPEALRRFPRRGVDHDPLEHQASGKAPTAVWVAVDGNTDSAANSFALTLLVHVPGARSIGTPPRGACDRHNGEIPVTWPVGDTGVTAMFSVVAIDHVAPESCAPGLPLQPDLLAPVTATDVAEGTDPVIRALRALR